MLLFSQYSINKHYSQVMPSTSPESTSLSPETNQEDFKVNQADYQILRPDSYHTSSKSQEELLERYIGLLVPLAELMIGKEGEPGFDSVIFLDKSARPLRWMLSRFWPHIAPQHRNEEGELVTATKPNMLFVNVDRLAWRKDHTKEFDDGGVRDITKEDIHGLRSIFTKDENHNLDDQRLLIVDEQSETGDTLRIAKDLFEKAFPTSEIQTTAWINHPYSVNASGVRESSVKEIPMWYPPKDATGLHDETGRGVFNPAIYDPDNPAHSKNFSPESYQFLSTPASRRPRYSGAKKGERMERERLNILAKQGDKEAIADLEKANKDPKSLKLQREIGQMLLDFETGKLRPAILSKREEILGQPMIEYNRAARAVREQRPKY